MLAWLAAGAMAQQMELGVGRAALLDPGVAVTAVTLSDSVVVEVIPVKSTLVVIGRKAGTTTLSVEHARGVMEWTVTVQPTGDLGPSGLLVKPPGEVLSLPVGDAVWCKVAGTTATMFLDQAVATFSPIGADRHLVQADGHGVADVVFETTTGPKVLTIAVTAEDPAKVPASCRRPTETITLAIGEERVVPVGRTVVAVDVGHPDIVFGKHVPDASKSLTLIGLKAGTSIVLVRSSDNEDPWARTVVVAPPQ